MQRTGPSFFQVMASRFGKGLRQSWAVVVWGLCDNLQEIWTSITILFKFSALIAKPTPLLTIVCVHKLYGKSFRLSFNIQTDNLSVTISSRTLKNGFLQISRNGCASNLFTRKTRPQTPGKINAVHGPLNRYAKLRVAHALGCITARASGLLTRGGENVPGIPGAYATGNLAYLVRGPCERWGKSPYWPLFGLLFWYPIFAWNHCNLFEDRYE